MVMLCMKTIACNEIYKVDRFAVDRFAVNRFAVDRAEPCRW